MNHYVPDFEMDNDQNLNSTSSTITNHKIDDDILELLWQDGQVVAQPQTHRKPQPSLPPPLPQQSPPQPPHHHLYMTEDEMATWLHYPLEDLYSELLSENQTSSFPPVSSVHHPSPPIPPTLPPPPLPPTTTTTNNFGLFSRMRGNKDLDKTLSLRSELTIVDSNLTPALATAKSVGEVSSPFVRGWGGNGGEVRLEKDRGVGEVTVSSSSGTSGDGTLVKTDPTTTGSEDTKVEVGAEDRKRKSKEVEESTNTETTGNCQDLEHEDEDDDDEKKRTRGHSTAKRSRAAQVHNLSERRRRDRINERMKALQELIPRCNKTDKASMLDEAIEYLKSLQMQVQMMSMGCNMVPMMYPGYIPQMGMDMGMARPMIPYPPNISGVNVPISPCGPQFGPRFSIPPAHMPCVSSSNLAGNEGGNQVVNNIRGPYPVQSPPGMAQVSSMGDPYQQYMAIQQIQMQLQMQMQQMQVVQNQAISQPGTRQPNTNKSEAHIGPSRSKEEFEDDN